MTFRKWISMEGKGKLEKMTSILGLSLLAFLLVTAGSVSCKKKAEEVAAPKEEGTAIKEGINEFEGQAKVGFGNYLFVPAAQGFDIVVQGQVESGDASALEGKEVKVTGEYSYVRPSILIANSIDVKEAGGQYRNVFTRTAEPVLDDYLELKDREAFQPLKITSFNKSEEWEGKGKVKIFGKLEKTTVTEAGAKKEMDYIVLSDEKGKEIGRIIVDRITDFALYYIKKLRLFDKFWFYITVKETVDRRVRTRTHELLHADVLFAGLF